MRLPDDREAFEEAAFGQRFLRSIRRDPNPAARFALGVKDCPTKAEFIAKRDELPCVDRRGSCDECSRGVTGCDGRHDEYKDNTLNAMWWTWCRRGRQIEALLEQLCDPELKAQLGARLKALRIP